MGKWYGSLDNRISEQTLQPIPTVGMGATEMLYSDRNAYTVLAVSEETITITQTVNVDYKTTKEVTRTYPRWIKALQDEAKVVKGSCQDGSASYEYSNSGKIENATTYFFHKLSGHYRKESTKWVDDASITEAVAMEKHLRFIGGYYTGSKKTNKDQSAICLGFRDEYYDPCF